jgi:hypothetical protein
MQIFTFPRVFIFRIDQSIKILRPRFRTTNSVPSNICILFFFRPEEGTREALEDSKKVILVFGSPPLRTAK